MRFFRTALPALALFASTSLVQAEPHVMVRATPTATSATSLGDTTAFMRRFSIFIFNARNEAIDLFGACLTLEDKDGKTYRLETVDDALTDRMLETAQAVNGFAVFQSEKRDVYEADLVKLKLDCEKGD